MNVLRLDDLVFVLDVRWKLEFRPSDDANPMIGHEHPSRHVAAGHMAVDTTGSR